MNRAVLAALTLTASVAHADDDIPRDPLDIHAPGDEPDGYAAAGLVWSTSQGYAQRGAIVDVGDRIGGGRSPWFVRVMGQAGKIVRSDEPGGGKFLELRTGLEGRSCTAGGMLCGAAGVDAGFVRADFQHEIIAQDGIRHGYSEDLGAFVAVPRLTIDAGGRIRFRGVLELPVRIRTADSPEPPTAVALGAAMPAASAERQSGMGVALSLALAVGF